MIDTLRAKMTFALEKYHQINNTFPETIIVFRDGVGDSQIGVLSHEIKQLKAAMRSIDMNYNPKFAFLVIQKRINTRILMIKVTLIF